MNLILALLQVACIIVTILTLWLIGNKNSSGMLIGALSQFVWATLFVYIQTPLLILTSVVYFVLYLRGFFNWKRSNNDLSKV